MIEIDSDIILATILKNKEKCTIQELLEAKKKIEDKFPDVYCDCTRNSILHAVEYYPSMFNWEDNCVYKVEGSDNKYSDDFMSIRFYSYIDKTNREDIINFLKTL